MNILKRVIFSAIGLVLIAAVAFVVLQVLLGLGSRDVLVREVESGELVFNFWVDREPLEEGDPSLTFEVSDTSAQVIQSKLTLGSAFDWYPSKTIDLQMVSAEGISAIILGELRSMPLVIWETDSGEFAPRGNHRHAESKWLLDALLSIAPKSSRRCLGYLSQGEVQCRP